jgi:hypothetical protein
MTLTLAGHHRQRPAPLVRGQVDFGCQPAARSTQRLPAAAIDLVRRRILVIRWCPLCSARPSKRPPRPRQRTRPQAGPPSHRSGRSWVHPQRDDAPGSPSSRPTPAIRRRRRRCRAAARARPDPRSHRPTRFDDARTRSATTRMSPADPATANRSGSATRSRSPPAGAVSTADPAGPCARQEATAPTTPTAHRPNHDDHARHHPSRTRPETFVRHALVVAPVDSSGV